MHLFSNHLWPGRGRVSRTTGWQEHPHMDGGGGTACREGSCVINGENIPKGFTVVKLKDSSNMNKVGIYRPFC